MADLLSVSGARGPGLTELARRTGNYGIAPTDGDYDALVKFGENLLETNPGFQSTIPGPAGPTFVTLASFRAAPSTNKKQALKVPGIVPGDFYFETTNPPYVDDGVSTIKANDTPLTTGAWVRQSAASLTYTPPVGPAVSTSGFLDSQGVTVGAANEIQPALDYLAGRQGHQAVKLAPGRVITMPDASLTIDGSYTFLEGNGSTLQWPVLTGAGKAAILIRGSANPPYLQATNVFDRLIFRGPRALNPAADVTNNFGVHFDGIMGGEFGPSNISMTNLIVDGFGIGVRHGHNSYLNHNRNIRVLNCLCGIEAFGSVANAGENIVYEGGAVFNNQLATRQADQSGSGMLSYARTSFDYNEKFAEVNSRGTLAFRDCWHEAGSAYTQRPITFAPGPDGLQDGATLVWNGGRFLMAEGAPQFDYWADVPAGAACHIRPDFAIRCRTSTGVAFTGAGESSFRFPSSFDAHGNNIVAHATKYGMLDGTMADPNVLDWFVLAADRTSEIAGPKVTLAKSTDVVLPGSTRSLKATKIGPSGGSASIFIGTRPVVAGQLIGRRLFWRKPGSQTGAVVISMRWGTMGVDAEGRKTLRYGDRIIGDIPLTLTSADSGWQSIEVPGAGLVNNRVPGGFDIAVILVSMGNMDAGDFHIGAAWMGEIG